MAGGIAGPSLSESCQMNDWSLIAPAWDLFIKITDIVLRLLNAAFFLMIAWFTIKEWKK
jgi:hypothetical protein